MIPPPGAALAALLVVTLKASALLLVALAAAALMRRASAAARHLVWAVALCGVLALPAVEGVVPAWELPLPALPAVGPAPASAADPIPVALPRATPAVVAPTARTAAPAPAAPVRSMPARRLPGDWRVWLAALWGAGAALVLVRLLAGLTAVWWMARRAVMVTDASWLHLAHELAHRFGLTRGVTLLRGGRGSVPMTWGVLQPVVWLPTEAEEWTPERRTVVLAHELAHVRRRDALTQWIAHLALAAYWFNPLVWLAVRRLREERERACDDAVLAAGARPVDYADHLLQIVRAFGTGGGFLPALAMARRSQFEGRLLAILDPHASRRALGWIGVALVGIAALGTVVPLAALRAAGPRDGVSAAAKEAAPAASPEARAAAGQDGSERYARRFGIPGDLAAAVLRAARAEGVDAELAFGLVRVESGFREALVSPRGAVGLTQLLPSTAATLRPGVSRRELLDRDTNLRLGFRYLRGLIGRYDGDVRLALHAYHRGPGTVARMRAEGLDPDASFADQVLRTTPAPAPDGADLERITRTLHSDGDRARLLTRLAAAPTTGESLGEVVRAVDAIGSDGDRASVLTAVIAQRSLPDAVRIDVLRSVARIGSDGDKATVLLTFLARHGIPDAVAPTFFAAVEAIGSDGDHHRVLSAVAARGGLGDAIVRRLLESAARIGSSGEKAAVLEEIARRGLVRGDALRDAYVRAAGTIGSDGDRARALGAVLAPPPGAAAQGQAPGAWNGTTNHREARDDRTLRTVTIRAKDVLRTPDGADVAGFLPGGSLVVEEAAAGGSRSLHVTPGAGGTERAYRVNGEPRPYDADARAWLAALLREFGK